MFRSPLDPSAVGGPKSDEYLVIINGLVELPACRLRKPDWTARSRTAQVATTWTLNL
jgi:hypothetical protein